VKLQKNNTKYGLEFLLIMLGMKGATSMHMSVLTYGRNKLRMEKDQGNMISPVFMVKTKKTLS
jgi:hypothetical protein